MIKELLEPIAFERIGESWRGEQLPDMLLVRLIGHVPPFQTDPDDQVGPLPMARFLTACHSFSVSIAHSAVDVRSADDSTAGPKPSLRFDPFEALCHL